MFIGTDHEHDFVLSTGVIIWRFSAIIPQDQCRYSPAVLHQLGLRV